MQGSAIPFLPPADPSPTAAPDAPSPDAVAREAARRAAEVDRRLAREQPAPSLGPVRGPEPVPSYAGSIPLPFSSPLHDPANLAGARAREVREFRPRVLECVACEYRKLENRLGDPEEHGVELHHLRPDQRQHFGPGERDYTVCKSCHDTNGAIDRPLYTRWAAERTREDAQRSFRHDPRFAAFAERVAAVDRWRRASQAGADLAGDLPAADQQPAPAGRDLDAEFDGIVVEERVPALSDFTGQRAGQGRARVGTPDPEFAAGAPYDAVRFRADEVEARMEDARWEARREEKFRGAWARTGYIEDPVLRRETRARLVERWDPRMSLVGEDRMEMTSPFAERHPRLAPFGRGVGHSGVDEGLDGEPAWRRAALARHEEAVARFLETMPAKLEQQGVSPERIAELTSLPPLNPGSEIGGVGDLAVLRERLERAHRLAIAPSLLPAGGRPTWSDTVGALVRVERPTFLAPAAALDAVAGAAALRHEVAADVERITVREAAPGTTDRDGFLRMARDAGRREALQAEVRAAEGVREHAQRWSLALRRADGEVRAATAAFAGELRAAFRDPRAFQAAFVGLAEGEKRAALRALREHPAEFPHAFASAHGRDAGRAAALAPAGPEAIERAGILTANAGERYLDAVRARGITRTHAARAMGLPEESPLAQVRQACTGRMDEAAARGTDALRAVEALGPPVPRATLERAFTGLHQADRRHVLREEPGLRALLDPPRRSLARSGPAR